MSEPILVVATIVTAGLGMALGVAMVALGQGYAAGKAFEALARQPEAQGAITRTLFVALAMLESLAIYVLVIELILIFANPALPRGR
jgi:F-type H+-transporting ATPase subunit c